MPGFLEEELKSHEGLKAELLAESKGRFVLIKKDRVVGVFEAEEEAIDHGYQQFADQGFLVGQILDIDPVRRGARDEATGRESGSSDSNPH
ncbi:MAG: hypothetical protein HYZ53_08740 [Planctomycetes bacterium]|nr:hypothetical protein [Planctomycetota bacterium]